jgi:toxin ParE1/3/4
MGRSELQGRRATRRRLRIRWSEAAAVDLEEIATYVAADSPLDARKLIATLKAKTDSLARMPERGRVVPELAYFGIRTWRELIVRPYRIIYRIAAGSVYVMAVLDGRRDLRDVLLERLLRTK